MGSLTKTLSRRMDISEKNFTPFHVLFPYCDDNPCIAMKPAGLFRHRFSPFIRHLPTAPIGCNFGRRPGMA